MATLRRRWWQQKNGDADLGKGELAGMLRGLVGGGGQPGAGAQGLQGLGLDPSQLQQLEELIKQMEQ